MDTMKAILVDEKKNLVWSDVPKPKAKSGEVLVEIHATALNRADLLQRKGLYPPPADAPEWMGLEVSGIVKDLGPTSSGKWSIGDRVCALLGGGGYAEYVTVQEEMLMPIPDTLSFEEAAALPEALATSYLNFYWEGGLKEHETVYIAAGSSGLSSLAIPMAKALGQRVITSVRSESQKNSIKGLGADVIVNTETTNLADVFKDEFDRGTPIKVAMDCLGGNILEEGLPYMAARGTWVIVSSLAGSKSTIDLGALLSKRLSIKGSLLRVRSSSEKQKLIQELIQNVWSFVEDRTIKATIHAVFPITEAGKAHDVLEQGGHVGKVILKVR